MQKCEKDNIQFRTMSFPKTGELHRQTESLNQLKTKWENINEKNPILSSTSISQNGFQKLPFCQLGNQSEELNGLNSDPLNFLGDSRKNDLVDNSVSGAYQYFQHHSNQLTKGNIFKERWLQTLEPWEQGKDRRHSTKEFKTYLKHKADG